MADNPLISLLRSSEAGNGLPVLLENAARTILDARTDPDRLDSCLTLLASARIESESGTPDGGSRAGIFRVLEMLAEELRAQHPSGTGSLDVAALASSVRTRAHALPVLQQLALGFERWAEVRDRLHIRSGELKRVFDWARDHSLIIGWKVGRESHYRLTSLGELSLRMIEEPAWLQPAAALVRVTLRGRLLRADLAVIASEASGMVGLEPAAARRGVDAILRALDPANTSRLAAALAVSAGEHQGVVMVSVAGDEMPYGFLSPIRGTPWDKAADGWERCRPVVRGEVLLERTFERCGLACPNVTEVPAARFVASGEPPRVRLPLDRPVVSMVYGINRVLLRAFGEPVEVDPQNCTVSWKDIDSGKRRMEPLGDKATWGMVIRLYDTETGVTHFVLGGIAPEGAYAASRGFYESIEGLLGEYPDTSFAAVVRLAPSQGEEFDRPVEIVMSIPLQTRDPGVLIFNSSWRPKPQVFERRSGEQRRSGLDRRASTREPVGVG